MDTLLPKKLSKNDASYKTVEDLNKALSVAEEQNIKNIAITGHLALVRVPFYIP